jgi:hypothetical protein
MSRNEWWGSEDQCNAYAQDLEDHLVALHIAQRKDATVVQRVLTGFLLQRRGSVVWATAGHVINEVRRLLALEEGESQLHWIDGCKGMAVPGVPVHDRSGVRTGSGLDGGGSLDFGYVEISGFDFHNLAANRDLKVIDDAGWSPEAELNSDSFILLGYPYSWAQGHVARVKASVLASEITAKLSSLPVELVDCPSGSRHKEIYHEPTALFGRIRRFTEGGDQPPSVEGMSGGPLFGLQDLGDQVRYQLVGTQRSWDPDERIIRCERVGDVQAWLAEGSA